MGTAEILKELKRRATEIRDEMIEGRNTATRVGQLFLDIISLDEGNEYVTLKTDQVIEGRKTFTQTITSFGDMIAYGSGDSPVSNIPIASPEQYGLSKYDNTTIGVNEKGQLTVVGGTGGGLDEQQLRKFLSDNHYIYDSSSTSPISSISESGDNKTFLDGTGKFRKLEPSDFGDLSKVYVTVKTNQNVEGQKTFFRTILCNQDMVAYASGNPTANIPVASQSQYGLAKYDNSTIGINSNGQLCVKGDIGGGGSNVTWSNLGNKIYERLTIVNDGVSDWRDVSLRGHTHDIYVLKGNTGWGNVTNHTAPLKIKDVEKTVSLNGHTHSQYITDQNNSIKELIGSGNKGQYLAGDGHFYTITHSDIDGLSDNYVTISTNQNVKGQKTFLKTIMCKQDVVAYASGNPTTDIPVSSQYQYGLTKFDNVTIGVNSSGQLYVMKDFTWSGGTVDNLTISSADQQAFHLNRFSDWCHFVMGGDTMSISVNKTGSWSFSTSFSFKSDGNARANGGVFADGSDIRFKNKLGNVDKILEKIEQLEGFVFTWKSDENKIPRIGLSAQDVQKVFPEAVYSSYDSENNVMRLYLHYGGLAAVIAINGLKELHYIVENNQNKTNKNLKAILSVIDGHEKTINQIKEKIASQDQLKQKKNDTEGDKPKASV